MAGKVWVEEEGEEGRRERSTGSASTVRQATYLAGRDVDAARRRSPIVPICVRRDRSVVWTSLHTSSSIATHQGPPRGAGGGRRAGDGEHTMHAPGLAGDGGQGTGCHLVQGATPQDSEVCTPQDSEVWDTCTKFLNQRVNQLYFRCYLGKK